MVEAFCLFIHKVGATWCDLVSDVRLQDRRSLYRFLFLLLFVKEVRFHRLSVLLGDQVILNMLVIFLIFFHEVLICCQSCFISVHAT
mmetsp:Transcript_24339/g.23955  ORF Transcript_24339/g.23955 Transcript_24339/m.23955 type:complete len:87 (+) Transcript_24339:1859-2119(+)